MQSITVDDNPVNSSYQRPSADIWNHNYKNVFLGGDARQIGADLYNFTPNHNFRDYDFEYRSNPDLLSTEYKMLFNLFDPGPTYTFADMVYWWNNGQGRPDES